jgi:hypothetical protein
MKRTRFRLLIAMAAAAATAAGITSAVQGSGRGAADGGVPAGRPAATASSIALSKCKTSKAEVVTNDSTISTSSTSFVEMPGMTTTFKSTKGCLIVSFSSEPFATNGDLIQITASLDGSTALASPSVTQLSGDDDENSDGKWARDHSTQFVFPLSTTGTHTVSILWDSFFGGTVFNHTMTMIVYHG